MIDFGNQLQAVILQRMLDRVMNTVDKREGSIIWEACAPAAHEFESLYLDLEYVQKNGFISTATDDEAVDNLVQVLGLSRRQATYAIREGEFNVPVDIGSRFSTINQTPQVTFVVTQYIGLQSDGYHHYQMRCETAGTIGNGYTGRLLPVTYVQGLTYSYVTTILIAGTDTETSEELKNRYYLALQSQPFGGNIASYRSEITAIDGVGTVQVYPATMADGTSSGGYVKCVIIDGNYNVATPELIQNVQNIICPPEADDTTPSANGYGIAPIGAIVTIATATPLTINVTMEVTLSLGSSVSQVQAPIEQAIEAYFLEVRQKWGSPITSNTVEYSAIVYGSRVSVAAISVDGVLNATVLLNGQADIISTENGTLQELPILGTVTITEA